MTTESIPLKATALRAVLTTNIEAGEPVCVAGPSGVGKSDINTLAVSDFVRRCIMPHTTDYTAPELIAAKRLLILHPVVDDPTDYKGLPVMTVNGAQFSVYGNMRLLQTATEPLTVFFDDLGHASQSVQAALMQLVLNLAINGEAISPHVRFIAATNRVVDRGAGVHAMLVPLKYRFLMLEFIPDLLEWQTWAAAHGISPKVIAYLSLMQSQERDAFCSEEPAPGMTVMPHPRGWHRVSRQLALNHSPDVLPAVFAGCVGKEHGAGFAGFLRIADSIVMPEVVWANPDRAPIPGEPSSLWALCSALAYKVTPATVGAFCKYMVRLVPAKREYAALAMRVMTSRDPSLQTGPDYISAMAGPLGALMLGSK